MPQHKYRYSLELTTPDHDETYRYTNGYDLVAKIKSLLLSNIGTHCKIVDMPHENAIFDGLIGTETLDRVKLRLDSGIHAGITALMDCATEILNTDWRTVDDRSNDYHDFLVGLSNLKWLLEHSDLLERLKLMEGTRYEL